MTRVGKEKLDAFHRIYDVTKETVWKSLPEKRFQLTDKTLDGGIFGGKDEGTIRRLKSGGRNITVATLQDIAVASNKPWLKDWKTKKMKGVINKGEALKYKDVFRDVYDQIKCTVAEMIEEESPGLFALEDCTTEQVIAVYLINALFPGGIMEVGQSEAKPLQKGAEAICVGRDLEKKQLDTILGELGGTVAAVCGKRLSGRTTMVKSYLRDTGFCFLNYDYRADGCNPIGNILKRMEPAQLKMFSLMKRSDGSKKPLGMDLYREKDRMAVLGKLFMGNEYAVIIDHFNGAKTEVEEAVAFARATGVNIILVTEQRPKGIEAVELPPLSAEMLVELFYETNKNEPRDQEKVVRQISEKLLGHEFLMQLVAKWYEKKKERESEIPLDELLPRLLDNLSAYTSEKMVFAADKIHGPYGIREKGKQLLLATHIVQMCSDILDDAEYETYLVLSCLGGVSLPKTYLERWLGLEPEAIDGLCDKGWCIRDYRDTDVMVSLPTVVATLNYADAHKKGRNGQQTVDWTDAWNTVVDFTGKFLREIRHEEYGVIDLYKIGEIIRYVNGLFLGWKEYLRRGEERRRFEDFYLSAIRFYYEICRPDLAKELMEDTVEIRKKLGISEDSLLFLTLKGMHGALGAREDIMVIQNIMDEYFAPVLNGRDKYTENEWGNIAESARFIVDFFMLQRIAGQLLQKIQRIENLPVFQMPEYIDGWIFAAAEVYQKACQHTAEKESLLFVRSRNWHRYLSDYFWCEIRLNEVKRGKRKPNARLKEDFIRRFGEEEANQCEWAFRTNAPKAKKAGPFMDKRAIILGMITEKRFRLLEEMAEIAGENCKQTRKTRKEIFETIRIILYTQVFTAALLDIFSPAFFSFHDQDRLRESVRYLQRQVVKLSKQYTFLFSVQLITTIAFVVYYMTLSAMLRGPELELLSLWAPEQVFARLGEMLGIAGGNMELVEAKLKHIQEGLEAGQF